MAPLQLIGTPLSHFTRKVRILLAELGIEVELVRPPGVLASAPETYGGNPLMRVPTLVDGELTLIESDHIARYLVRKHDPDDRLGVRSDEVRDLNRRAVVNGVMANEVVLILARRGGLTDIDGVAYFRKLAAAIDHGLAWLDQEVEVDAARFDYGDIATICMWQHLLHYQLRPDLDRYRRIAARVARFAERPSVASTTPAISLADAAAAGWKPA
ncbi:MAG TPA: glutathione S-transferase family protein [Kofleriaceae bacterium]|nr:glutathione S-transferase family protein [Kofleriaceae bacterium]